MQIVYGDGPDIRPDDNVVRGKDRIITGLKKTDNSFILIGDRQENIYIEKDGRLYFTINDVPLDDATILKMMCEICEKPVPLDLLNLLRKADSLRTEYDKLRGEGKGIEIALDSCYKGFLNLFYIESLATKKGSKHGPSEFGNNPYREIELYGYYMERYIEPWYEDNVGSFLIVVETSTK